jgi:ergothioneine biosynthesis protein EgtB
MRSALAVDRSTPGPITSSSPLAAQYVAVRQMTEKLCAPLSAEDQMVQSMPDASPSKWHQAHTSWFFETFILLPYVKGYRPLDDRYTYFLNSYYKQLGGHPVRAQRGMWSRPSLEAVRQYRSYVDEHTLRLLDGEVSPEIAALVTLGLNHEQQHQELIVTDIKHALWTNPLRPAYRERAAAHRGIIAPLQWTEYPGGIHSIGYEGDGFSFDNETPRHEVLLQPFSIASRLIINAEYMQFMNDGGYTRPELWLSDAWDTVCANAWRAPLYWEQRDGQWRVYTLNGERAVDPAEPVCHVSFYEADAYARWAGARLATEFEWEVAAAKAGRGTAPSLHNPSQHMAGNLLESDVLHPVSIGAPSAKGEGCGTPDDKGSPHQLFGDVWEWTASPYVAYPGFRPAAGVLGEYNGKFMCNQMVLRGGSCATPTSHIRATYRNFFPPHARWQFSGIRLAHD